ncbi:hypothetical protein ABIB99_004801 [Bradyrhizobium sp. LA6.1]
MNTNHHLSKPAATGTFEVVWQSASPIKASVLSRYLPESARRTADWTFLWVCGGCAEPSFKDWVILTSLVASKSHATVSALTSATFLVFR